MKKTAFISIVGRPNIGKSTLVNNLLNEKVSIVSSRPQTTRNNIRGILTEGENQYVFLDTPGMFSPKNKLGKYMVKSIYSSIDNADIILFVVDSGYRPSFVEKNIIEMFKETNKTVILLLNKIDLTTKEKIANTIVEYTKLYDFNAYVPISAKNKKNLSDVMQEINKNMIEDEWYYPEDIYTDQKQRDIVCEVVREKILNLIHDEVPHGTAVSVESYNELENIINISVLIICEKTSHKGILIGKDGGTLKKIGVYAREDLEKILSKHVFLELYVKARDNWRDNNLMLKELGYNVDDIK